MKLLGGNIFCGNHCAKGQVKGQILSYGGQALTLLG